MTTYNQDGVIVLGSMQSGFERVINQQSLQFLAALHRAFEHRRKDLMIQRCERQTRLDSGEVPSFNPSTQWIRDSDWRGPSIPTDLTDRRVEITGPVSRKMVINALNSGANVFMADFEDATAPTWFNLVDGQINLYDAVRKSIEFNDSKSNKKYKLNDKHATLMVRPRGWHLEEAHIVIDGQRMSASLFDFGLFFHLNAAELLKRGSGPYFYVPKLEGAHEARLWRDVFDFSERYHSVKSGSIRCTVLLETILASFELDEILYELRAYSAGANCGRWDYLFSMIKKFSANPKLVTPERSLLTMTVPFMRNYVLLLINTCHRRGVHAMGGMAAQIPIPNDPAANEKAMNRVKEDKTREVQLGHDGTWISHPGLAKIAFEAFNESVKPHRIAPPKQAHGIQPDDLLDFSGIPRTISPDAIKSNIKVALGYLSAWLQGIGCVPINGLMEDAATAEISRAQLWQWHRHSAKDTNGKVITLTRLIDEIDQIAAEMRSSMGEKPWEQGKWHIAVALLTAMTGETHFEPFLTNRAYEFIIEPTAKYYVPKTQQTKSKL